MATGIASAPSATPPSDQHMVSRDVAAAGISPKTNAAALGGAIATILWAIAGATIFKNTFPDGTVAVLTGGHRHGARLCPQLLPGR